MKKWWHDKIVYQIYPKSFFDSNGDGIGDIQGIIQKLDYIKSLGADILWICPMYPSPMADQGYDISDYYNIDPTFGTLDDMDRLISESKKRGMYVIMDLVVNHCSDEHEWFRKACQEPGGKYGKYFYIEDIKDGKLPCNWRGIFGGSVWSELPGHPGKVYLHTFHKKQPDLNWENPKVRQEVYKIINFWLDHGLSGFRVDAIVNIILPFPLYVFFMVGGAMVALVTSLNACIGWLQAPIAQAAEDGWWPKFLAKRNDKFGTPHYIIATIYIVASIIILSGINVSDVANISNIFGNCVQVVLCLSIINMPKKIPELWKHSQFHINDNLYRSLCFLGAFVAAVFVIYECLTIQMFQVIGILIYLCISCIYPALRAKYSNVEIHVSYEET